MPRRVITTAVYLADARETFLAALDFREMSAAMKGLSEYEGLPDGPVKEGETYTVDVTTWKLFKTTGYEMFIKRVDKDALVLQSREHGGLIKSWDHHLSLRQDKETAIWIDDVVVDAGWMSPLMVRFCAYMYLRRHRYRQAQSVKSEVFLTALDKI